MVAVETVVVQEEGKAELVVTVMVAVEEDYETNHNGNHLHSNATEIGLPAHATAS